MDAMTQTLYHALAAFIAARRDYDRQAARSKARWYDADARSRCHLALSALQRAEAALLAAWDAEQADPVPALLSTLERTATQ